MMKDKKIYFFIGTTAELIKLAPVIRELKTRKVDFKLIETGQNEIHFEELSYITKGKLKPDISLGKKPKRSSILLFAIWSIKTLFFGLVNLREEFKKDREKIVIVHGDTVSSLIASIITRIYGLKLAHVESGLRSFSFLEPFPEEITRYIISSLADIHFCPNLWALGNLKDASGIKVNTRENTLIESYWMVKESNRDSKAVEKISDKYFVFTMHRQEHVLFSKRNTKRLLKYVLENAEEDLTCIFIVHAISVSFFKEVSPELPESVKRRLVLMSRLSYIDFINLVENAEYLVTDGGSNQEESYYMGKPCLIIRNVTERIEGLGNNVVLSKGDRKVIGHFLKNFNKYKTKKVRINKRPSTIIINHLLSI